jgi:hypothetical protein
VTDDTALEAAARADAVEQIANCIKFMSATAMLPHEWPYATAKVIEQAVGVAALRAENERLTAKLEMMGQLHGPPLTGLQRVGDQDTADKATLDIDDEAALAPQERPEP